MTRPAPASAYFRTWRDLEALLATQRWTVRASPAIGDGADVLYFVPPEGSDIPTVQVRHLGKALQASVWALRGSAGSMMALDPDTAASVEPRKPQWRVEAMAPDHPVFDTRDSFTLVCGDVLVALGLMERPVPDHRDALDALGYGLAATEAPPRETATEALQRRVDAAAALDPAFTVHDAGYSPDHFGTTADMVEAARLMDLLDGDDVSDADLQAVMAMPLDAPGRDEAMTRVFGDDRRNWPGDPADMDGPAWRDAVAGRIPGVTYHGGVVVDPNTPPVDMLLVEGDLPRAAAHPGLTREAFAAALMAAKRRPPAWRRFLLALGRLAGVVGRRLQAGL
jgi:hypothetical protein